MDRAQRGKQLFGSKSNQLLETSYFDTEPEAIDYAKKKKSQGYRADVTKMLRTWRVRVESESGKEPENSKSAAALRGKRLMGSKSSEETIQHYEEDLRKAKESGDTRWIETATKSLKKMKEKE